MSPAATACRSCGGTSLEPVLSFGRLPLANALVAAEALEAPEARYPLDLAFCPACTLVQITETVPPEVLFRDYAYFSSYSDTAVAHARALADRTIGSLSLDARSRVLEVASNDGYLLSAYAERGIPVLGIEPARNVARVARERGIPTLEEFFDVRVADALAAEGRRAQVVHANNVLAHAADLHGVVEGIRRVLAPGGVALVEVPYLLDLVQGCEFDTIYHEHLCYFSLAALRTLFAGHGLDVFDVERIPVHGGSLRIHATAAGSRPVAGRVGALLAREEEAGLGRLTTYRDFATRVGRLCASLRETLAARKASGRRIAGYGATAKSSTLLLTAGIGPETIDYIADRSPHKQGRFSPGGHIPIVGPERIARSPPDDLLILAWNLADEVMGQFASFHAAGGRFILPVPSVRVL